MYKFSALNLKGGDLDDMLGLKKAAKKGKSNGATTNGTTAQNKPKTNGTAPNQKNKKTVPENKTATPADSAKTNKKKAKSNANGAQESLDEWNKRNEKLLAEENATALQQAIIESKLEAQKTQEDRQQALKDQARLKQQQKLNGIVDKSDLKKKKRVQLSLAEFNTRTVAAAAQEKAARKKEKTPVVPVAEDFFGDADDALKKVLRAEGGKTAPAPAILTAAPTARSDRPPPKVPYAEVEKRDFEIQALRLEVASLKRSSVELRRTLAAQQESLSAASHTSYEAIVEQMELISKERTELTVEVASLSQQLEQERSKNRKK